MEMIKDRLPEEYLELRKQIAEERRISYRAAIVVTWEMMFFVAAPVVALLYSLPVCYIVLIVGLGAVLLTRVCLVKKQGYKVIGTKITEFQTVSVCGSPVEVMI